MSFLSFTLDEAKTVKINPGMNIKTFEIRPYVAAMIGEPNGQSTTNRVVVKQGRALALGRNQEYTLWEDGRLFLGK